VPISIEVTHRAPEKAAHARYLAHLNSHQTVSAANLRSYADELDAEAARIEAEQPSPMIRATLESDAYVR
jgi:hypothetical protein